MYKSDVICKTTLRVVSKNWRNYIALLRIGPIKMQINRTARFAICSISPFKREHLGPDRPDRLVKGM